MDRNIALTFIKIRMKVLYTIQKRQLRQINKLLHCY